jgi:hypothetical protein
MAQNNDHVTRVILLGMTGGGMYHSSMSCFFYKIQRGKVQLYASKIA